MKKYKGVIVKEDKMLVLKCHNEGIIYNDFPYTTGESFSEDDLLSEIYKLTNIQGKVIQAIYESETEDVYLIEYLSGEISTENIVAEEKECIVALEWEKI